MINNDRIIPITVIDLISMYGLILKRTLLDDGDEILTSVDATTTDGHFDITENIPAAICSEPVSTINFLNTVNSANIYFVPAYDYEGITVDGVKKEPGQGTVNADGKTLYRMQVAGSTDTILIYKAGF